MDGSEGSALSSAQSLHEITSTLLSSTSEAIITTTATSNIFNTTTPDDATYIADRLGAKHLPLTTSIPISVVYAIIFVVGVLGNVSTICVILKNKYMHTSTNVYLANLAMSDLLTHLVGKFFFAHYNLYKYNFTEQTAIYLNIVVKLWLLIKFQIYNLEVENMH